MTDHLKSPGWCAGDSQHLSCFTSRPIWVWWCGRFLGKKVSLALARRWWLRSPGVVYRGRNLDLGSSLGGLLGEQDGVDVGQHSTRGNSDLAKQLAQLLVIAHCQLDVPWDNPGLLVVTGCIASKLQNLSREVLQHCCKIDWGTSSDSRGVLALLEVASNTSDRELQGAGTIETVFVEVVGGLAGEC